MKIEAFQGLIGKKLSIMLGRNKPSGIPESYVVILEEIADGYLVFDYSGASYEPDKNPIEKIIIVPEEIRSIWLYKDTFTKYSVEDV
ncbi:hypothetical protein LCGC14_1145920 [marine sediment metagenome]|uniref:Uncharacterized protein n=1 Tax=marine sediment metagenome TaxID=412755 RepID=A0A0F9M1R4_9ZZZZ